MKEASTSKPFSAATSSISEHIAYNPLAISGNRASYWSGEPASACAAWLGSRQFACCVETRLRVSFADSIFAMKNP